MDKKKSLEKVRKVRPAARSKEKASNSKIPPLKPGSKALQEIRQYQHSTQLLLSKGPFQKLVKEIMEESVGRSYRIQTGALKALQEASESLIVDLFERSNLATVHDRRVTVFPRDLRLVQRLSEDFDFCL